IEPMFDMGPVRENPGRVPFTHSIEFLIDGGMHVVVAAPKVFFLYFAGITSIVKHLILRARKKGLFGFFGDTKNYSAIELRSDLPFEREFKIPILVHCEEVCPFLCLVEWPAMQRAVDDFPAVILLIPEGPPPVHGLSIEQENPTFARLARVAGFVRRRVSC